MDTRPFDIAVIGGSLGGVQAARAACAHGRRVYLCEETLWIGGQLTSQAVPPDEHPWIEHQGATRSYLDYRQAVREAYRNDPAASPEMPRTGAFDPGQSWVSALAHDPRVAHRLLTKSLAEYVKKGLLTIALETRCVSAEVEGDRVLSVTVEDRTGTRERITAAFFLDGTDMGDLLPLTGTAYRVGAESREETGEPSAPEKANPEDHQPITWVAALELCLERPPMEKPAGYERWRGEVVKGAPQLGWDAWGAHGLTRYAMFDHTPGAFELGLWTYRRIVYPPFFTDGRREATLLNWPQNDYIAENIIDNPRRAEHLEEARELTRCCAYWLWEQGYPIRQAGEITGTADGLAMAPYIRESRRIAARKTILEQELTSPEQRGCYPDSIGIGHYHIDLHITTRTHTTLFKNVYPFEIPLRALIPVDRANLLPAAKNIGATHLTGGCFRLHPVEWTIGEAAGHLAAFCLETGLTPAQVSETRVTEFQQVLTDHGFQLHWRRNAEGEIE